MIVSLDHLLSEHFVDRLALMKATLPFDVLSRTDFTEKQTDLRS
jgi:hypothetical protein